MRALMPLIGALLFAVAVQAQPPAAPAQAVQAPAQPTLPAELRLERDNLLLQARINELETQLAALKAQFINEQIGKAAPALIQKLQAAAPEWDVNPQTLELTPKKTAAQPAPATPPPPTPSPQPQQP